MTTPATSTAAATLIRAFIATRSSDGDTLEDRAALARFLRAHDLVPAGPIPITVADFEEAVALRDGLCAQLFESAGLVADAEARARGRRVLDGLRMTAHLAPDEAASPLTPAVVAEVRKGLARIAGAWAVVLATGEWRDLRPQCPPVDEG